MGPGTETRKSLVDEHLWSRNDGGDDDKYQKRLRGRRHGQCKQGLVEGCEDLQKQRRAVQGEMQENGGARLLCNLLWK